MVCTRHGRLDGVECNRGGVAARRTDDDLAASPLAPDAELLAGGCAKGVARTEDHTAPRGHVARGELADRSRLARAVDAENQDHMGGSLRGEPFGGFDASKLLEDRRAKDCVDRLRIAAPRLRANFFEQAIGRLDSQIRLEEQRLQLIEQLRVDGSAPEQLADPTDQPLPGQPEAIPHARHWRGRDGLRRGRLAVEFGESGRFGHAIQRNCRRPTSRTPGGDDDTDDNQCDWNQQQRRQQRVANRPVFENCDQGLFH